MTGHLYKQVVNRPKSQAIEVVADSQRVLLMLHLIYGQTDSLYGYLSAQLARYMSRLLSKSSLDYAYLDVPTLVMG